ncbi:MAG: hypothetical protein ABJB69_04160 [Spartobacteria bacterium]
MKPVIIFHIVFALLTSAAPLFAESAPVKATTSKPKAAKQSDKLSQSILVGADSLAVALRHLKGGAAKGSQSFSWKSDIVTTVFWVGEEPSGNNPTPNRCSSWDKDWTGSYGGFDDPKPERRSHYAPVKFTPRQNPFYCALPYNDKAREGHRPEAPTVVPWFKAAYQGPGFSTCKGHWLAIRKGNRVVYAQWEDAGPFRTDHWQYVFGDERPKPNLNQGAGLDVSPAVRDYLGLKPTDVTDWKFVDFKEVPRGPWSKLGDNNTFVINERKKDHAVVEVIGNSAKR